MIKSTGVMSTRSGHSFFFQKNWDNIRLNQVDDRDIELTTPQINPEPKRLKTKGKGENYVEKLEPIVYRVSFDMSDED